MIRALLVSVLFAAAPLSAQAESVLVLNARVVDGELHGVYAAQLNASIRFALGEDTGKRMLDQALDYPKNCERKCLADFADKHEANFVVAPSVYNGDTKRLVVRVHDRVGNLVAEGERAYSTEIGPKVVESLAIQLLSPPRYAGSILLVGVPADADVNIDAIPVRGGALGKPIILRVGTHRVEVERGNASFVNEVEVAYRSEQAIQVRMQDSTPIARPRVVEKVSVGFPAWPSTVTTGAAVAAGVVGAVFLGDFFLMPLYRGDALQGVAAGPEAPTGVSRPVLIARQLQAKSFAEARTARSIDLVVGTSFVTAAVLLGSVAMYLGGLAPDEGVE